MKTVTVYGASDDLFCVEAPGVKGAGHLDEVECYDDVGWFDITSSEGSVRVFGTYEVGGGVWGFGLAPIDEDVEIPNWNVSFKLGGRGYSSEMTLNVPDDAVVSNHSWAEND